MKTDQGRVDEEGFVDPPNQPKASPEDLAGDMRAFRETHQLTLEQAGAILHIPWRTIEGIEQGRGFRYPQLLSLAMDHVDDNPDLLSGLPREKIRRKRIMPRRA